MNLQQVLTVIRDAVNYLEVNGMFVNGTVDFNNVQKDANFASAVEASLKRNGVEIPNQVDSVIAMLPILLQLGSSFGSKG